MTDLLGLAFFAIFFDIFAMGALSCAKAGAGSVADRQNSPITAADAARITVAFIFLLLKRFRTGRSGTRESNEDPQSQNIGSNALICQSNFDVAPTVFCRNWGFPIEPSSGAIPVARKPDNFPRALRQHEALLFDAFTAETYRGMNLMPVLRHRLYACLREMGRTTCFSTTDFFNAPAVKFKQKLGAKRAALTLYLRLFDRWNRVFLLYRYR